MLQVIYYSFCVFIFALGLSYATAASVIFFRDLSQIINIVLQVLVWMTPIMWNMNDPDKHIPETLKFILKLNPMYYIASGYRNALIDKEWFWEHPLLTVYFWVVTLIIFFFGIRTFKKLRVHFADVL